MKGSDMAVSKHNGASGCDTNPFFLELFRDHSESDERERIWHTAMLHAGEGAPPLRFPVYECLYLINMHSQKLVDLLGELSNRFAVEHDSVAYYQSLIQCVRAGASQDIVSFMNDVELTEEWLCHQAGGELEQIQFLLGHVSVQTTERYLGCKQRFHNAVNDRMGIEPDPPGSSRNSPYLPTHGYY
jgi:hypothetical protein